MGVIMETLCKIVIMFLFTFTMGEDTLNMEDITEMMRDMNIRLYWAEDELAETKIKLMTTEKDLAATKQDLNIALTELMTTKTDLASTNLQLNNALNEVVEAQTKKNNELESEIK